MGTSAVVIDPTTGERIQSGPPQIDPATGERVSAQPQHDFSSLLHNPNGEGTYKIATKDGQTLDVPYSNVPVFQGLQGTSFASPSEQTRFEKDAEADPHRPTFWNALTNPVGSGGREQGFGFPGKVTSGGAAELPGRMLGEVLPGGATQVGGQAIKAMAQPLMHPINTLEGMGKVASDAVIYGPQAVAEDVAEPVAEQYVQDKKQGGNALALENLGGQVLGNVEGPRLLPMSEMAARARAAFDAAREGVRGSLARRRERADSRNGCDAGGALSVDERTWACSRTLRRRLRLGP